MEYDVKNILTPSLYNDVLSITNGDTDFTRFKNKTVIVTGAGQLPGFYIVCALLLSNDNNGTDIKVVAAETDDSLFRLYGKLTYRGDIDFVVSSDYSYFQRGGADFVIHTDSVSPTVTLEATANLLDFVAASKARAVINSSADIYGDVFNGKSEISEEDTGYFDCASGLPEIQEERMAESLALKLARENGADISLTRTNIIFGGFEFKNRLWNMLSDVSRGNNPVADRGDSFPESICYVTDAARALIQVLLDGESGEAYNISCGINTGACGFAAECAKVFPDLKPVYEGKERALSPMAPTLRILSDTKLRGLGFKSKVDLAEGIERSVKIINEFRERGE